MIQNISGIQSSMVNIKSLETNTGICNRWGLKDVFEKLSDIYDLQQYVIIIIIMY